jgi:hypothetical protein
LNNTNYLSLYSSLIKLWRTAFLDKFELLREALEYKVSLLSIEVYKYYLTSVIRCSMNRALYQNLMNKLAPIRKDIDVPKKLNQLMETYVKNMGMQ